MKDVKDDLIYSWRDLLKVMLLNIPSYILFISSIVLVYLGIHGGLWFAFVGLLIFHTLKKEELAMELYCPDCKEIRFKASGKDTTVNGTSDINEIKKLIKCKCGSTLVTKEELED